MTSAQVIYELASEYARDEIKFDKDTTYRCGSSFVKIKWGSFCREMKKLDLVRKDAYYGWILETNEPVHGTLEQEKYNQAFVKSLQEQGVTAYERTLLN